MNLTRTARNIYTAIKDTPASVTAVRDEVASLALELATTDKASFELTSSTVNGQSFAGQRTMTKQQRFNMLSLVVAMLDNSEAISNQALPRF